MKKQLILSALVSILFIFGSCSKEEPIVADNSNKSCILDAEIFDNTSNPMEYIGDWNHNILERIFYYYSLPSRITDGYDLCKQACIDILGDSVRERQLLTRSNIERIKADECNRYSQVILNTGLTERNKEKLNTLMDDLFSILEYTMPASEFSPAIIKVLEDFEKSLLVYKITREEAFMLGICALGKTSTKLIFEKLIELIDEPITVPIDFESVIPRDTLRDIGIRLPINVSREFSKRIFSGMAAAISTYSLPYSERIANSMLIDAKMTCASAMTTMYRGNVISTLN